MMTEVYPPVRLKLAIKATCSVCGMEIPAGTVVFWDRKEAVFHMDCEAAYNAVKETNK